MRSPTRFFVTFLLSGDTDDYTGTEKKINCVVVTALNLAEAKKKGSLMLPAVVRKYNDALEPEQRASSIITTGDIEIEVEEVEPFLQALELEAAQLSC